MAGQGLIFGEVATADAVGTILAHGLIVGGDRWSKGRQLTATDIRAAFDAGIDTLTVAWIGSLDTAEDEAAAGLAAVLAGSGVVAAPAAHGRANLVARAAGVVVIDAAAVDRVNAVDEGITLGTLAPYSRVAAGEVLATIKIIPYAVPTLALGRAAAAARRPLRVAAFAPLDAVLIQTVVAGTSDKMLAKTEAVTRARIAALGGTLTTGPHCPHTTAALADVLAAHPGVLLLVAGASATADRRDVIPAAIDAAGGIVERLGMPVDPGNLLCLGRIGGHAVIGLPGCARSPKRNGFDWVLERLAAGIAVTGGDIARMGVGGLLPEAERPQPRVAAHAPGIAGAIVLAAGRSTRMGANKLLADLDGRPVIAHVVDAVAAAGLPPPVVVVGHMADAIRAALSGRDAVFVEAPDFAQGMSRSLRAGLRAVPPAWSAVLVCLGDMPRVGAVTLAALASQASTTVVAAPVWAAKRGNPLLWGRAHFAALAGIDGDVGGKALLAGLDVTEIDAADDGVLADVDTPEALAAMRDETGYPATHSARA